MKMPLLGAAGGSSFVDAGDQSAAFDTGAWASDDRRTHVILCDVVPGNGEGGRLVSRPPCLVRLHRSSGRLLGLAGRTTLLRLLRGLARALASNLANRLARLASLRRLARLLYLLSHLRFLIFTCVGGSVGWELFDSPCIFFAEFGLQEVSASTGANFSACSSFSLRMHCANSLRALIFKARSIVRACEKHHARGCARR